MASIARRQSVVVVRKYNNFLRGFVCRTLLSDSDTKLEGYLRQRIFIIDQLGPTRKALLMCKLKEVKTSHSATGAAIGIADLIHVAETEEELSELDRLFRLISNQDITNSESFSFGSSLLRLYHHLGLPDRAYRLYKDPVCRLLLSNNTCHKILMDLLFKHEQYDLVLDVYSSLHTFNIDCVTLAFGAHYHINTQESAEAAHKLVEDLNQQHSLSRRALLYAAMLSLNQSQLDAALKTLRKCKGGNLVVNLLLMCHAKQGQIQDVIKGLEEAFERAKDITKPLNVRLYSDTMMEVRQVMTNCDNQKDIQMFNHLDRQLSSMGVFSQQKATLLLDKTIFGDRDKMKESGKKKIIRVEQ